MARITSSAQVLLVSDVVASAAYFRDAVGFEISDYFGDPPSFCICNRDGHHLMLALAPADKIVPFWKVRDLTWNAYFWVDDAEEMYRELIARGAHIDYELCTQPYGVREFGIQDLDDQDIAFGQVL